MGLQQLVINFKDEHALDLFVDNQTVRDHARNLFYQFEGAFHNQGYCMPSEEFLRQVYLPVFLKYEEEKPYRLENIE